MKYERFVKKKQSKLYFKTENIFLSRQGVDLFIQQ